MTKHLPGGPSAHVDTFSADNLPPKDQWPVFDYDTLPVLKAYPDRINAGVVLLDKKIGRAHV